MAMIRTNLYIPKDILDEIDAEVDQYNHGFPEKIWDRSKAIRIILRNYIDKKRENLDRIIKS